MAKLRELALFPFSIVRPLLRRRLPKGEEIDRVLIVGSAPDDIVQKVLHAAAVCYPKAQIAAYVHHDDVESYRRLFPDLQVWPIDGKENTARPFELIRHFRSSRYTLGAFIWGRGPAFWRRKLLAILSGAPYLAFYIDGGESYNLSVWSAGFIASHLWGPADSPSKTVAQSTLSGVPSERGLGVAVSITVAYGLNFGKSMARRLGVFLIPVGYLVILARAAPLLLSGLTTRDGTFIGRREENTD